MEIVPFLIFLFIAFKVFSTFTKAASSEQGKTAKEMMKRLNAQIQEASQAQGRTSDMKRKGPTARGRERMAQREQSSPWNHKHNLERNNKTLSPGEQVAANYLKARTRASRKASHKSPEQHGRRGKNMDQNRHRTDGWGQRGDRGILNGKTLIILLVIGGGILYVLSNMPAT